MIELKKYKLQKRIGVLTCRLIGHDWTSYPAYYGVYGDFEKAGYCERCGADTHAS